MRDKKGRFLPGFDPGRAIFGLTENNPRWNETGRMVNGDGYVVLRVGSSHQLSSCANGYAYEHLVIWAASGRRLPERGEVLHHRNWNRADNRLSNLELMSRDAHAAMSANMGGV